MDLLECKFSIDLLNNKLGISLHRGPSHSHCKEEKTYNQSFTLNFVVGARKLEFEG